jgi:hypothetical protein
MSAAMMAAALMGFTAHTASADSIAMDQPVPMGNVETVCTGIADSKDDPRWPAYPIRVEFSNGGAQYLAGAHVTLTQGGTLPGTPTKTKHRRHKTASAGEYMPASMDSSAPLASFDCLGSWVLFKLPPGTYTVRASLLNPPGPEKSATFATSGEPPQKRVVIQFPLEANQ